MRFAHDRQGLHVVRCVPAVDHQTDGADRDLAHQTVHDEVVVGVFGTGSARVAPSHLRPRSGPPPPPRSGEGVFGERAPRRMTGVPARVAVGDLALFAGDGRVPRRHRLAQLTLEGEVPRRTVPLHHGLHHPVLGQVVGARLVEIDRLTADRAREGEGCRKEDAVARRAHVTARPGGAHDAAVRLAEDGHLVALLVIADAASSDAAAAAGAAAAAAAGVAAAAAAAARGDALR